MKKIVAPLFLLVLSWSVVQAQETAPSAALEMINDQYPNAQYVVWEQEDDVWEVEFESDGMEFEIQFDANGEWTQTEKTMDLAAIPGAIMDEINKKYQGWAFQEADVIESPDGPALYEIEMEKPGQELELLVDENGNILGEEIEVEEGEE